MTVLNPPVAVQTRTDTNADDLRGALAGHLTGVGGTAMTPRAGIVPGWGAELSVAQRGTPGMGVLVGAGQVVLPAPTAGHGGWTLINDGSLDVPIAASHATLPRTDLVIARVADPQYHAGGDGAASIKVVTGTAGSGSPVPTVPAAEGAYVVLAQVAVAAGASSITNANITLNTSASRAFTVAAGGVLPVANAAARTALTPHVGQHVIEADTAREYVWTGTAWKVQSAMGGSKQYSQALTSSSGAGINAGPFDTALASFSTVSAMDVVLRVAVMITSNSTSAMTTGGGICGMVLDGVERGIQVSGVTISSVAWSTFVGTTEPFTLAAGTHTGVAARVQSYTNPNNGISILWKHITLEIAAAQSLATL